MTTETIYIHGTEVDTILQLSRSFVVHTEDGRQFNVPNDGLNRDYNEIQKWISEGGVPTVIASVSIVGGDAEDMTKGFTITLQGGAVINAPGDPTDQDYQNALYWLGDGNEATPAS